MLSADKFQNPMHILRLQSHQTQGVFVVSCTEKGLIQTYKELWRRDDYIPTDYHIGKIVDLPIAHASRLQDLLWHNKYNVFRSVGLYEISNYHEEFGEFPPGISPCSCFPKAEKFAKMGRWAVFEPQRSKFGGDSGGHPDCCGTRILLGEQNWLQLFVKSLPAGWDANVPKTSKVPLGGGIYIAKIGGHQSGANICALGRVKNFYAAEPYKELLFAFTGAPLPIPAALQSWRRLAGKGEQKRRADEEEARRQKHVAESTAYRKAVYSSMGLAPDFVEQISDRMHERMINKKR